MGFFKKKSDPITERARALSAEIAALEDEIRALSSHVDGGLESPRPRFALPRAERPAPPPVFEKPEPARASRREEAEITSAHFNDLGVRKFDLAGAWRRAANHVYGAPVSNPKLVRYLASGGVQGLRPLRYERRVARNRTLFLLGVLIVVFYGLFAMLFRNP